MSKETEILRECSDQASCPSFRFVSDYPFRKIGLVAGGSTSTHSDCFLSEKGLLFKLLDVSQRVIVVRK